MPDERHRMAQDGLTPNPGGPSTRRPVTVWVGATQARGYGRFLADRRVHLAHRWSYQAHVADIPSGKVIDHLCRNPSCVNPEHLEAVDQGTNIARGLAPAAVVRRTNRCGRGHDLTDPANVYVWPRQPSQRHCRACRAVRMAMKETA